MFFFKSAMAAQDAPMDTSAPEGADGARRAHEVLVKEYKEWKDTTKSSKDISLKDVSRDRDGRRHTDSHSLVRSTFY